MCRRHILSITPHEVWGINNQSNNASRRDALSMKYRITLFFHYYYITLYVSKGQIPVTIKNKV